MTIKNNIIKTLYVTTILGASIGLTNSAAAQTNAEHMKEILGKTRSAEAKITADKERAAESASAKAEVATRKTNLDDEIKIISGLKSDITKKKSAIDLNTTIFITNAEIKALNVVLQPHTDKLAELETAQQLRSKKEDEIKNAKKAEEAKTAVPTSPTSSTKGEEAFTAATPKLTNCSDRVTNLEAELTSLNQNVTKLTDELRNLEASHAIDLHSLPYKEHYLATTKEDLATVEDDVNTPSYHLVGYNSVLSSLQDSLAQSIENLKKSQALYEAAKKDDKLSSDELATLQADIAAQEIALASDLKTLEDLRDQANAVITPIVTKALKAIDEDKSATVKTITDAATELDGKGVNLADTLDLTKPELEDCAEELADDSKVEAYMATVNSSDPTLSSSLNHLMAQIAIAQESNKEVRKKMENNSSNLSNASVDVSQAAAAVVTSNITNRMNRVAANVAAGENDTKVAYGAWVKGTIGTAKQKKYKDYAGYAAKSSGVTIGADAEFNDDLVLGLAFSHVNSDFKFKENRTGDKIKATSNVISVYGQKNITDNVYISGITSWVKSNIKSTSLKAIGLGKEKLAIAKSKSEGGSVNAKLHYIKKFDNGVTLTPFVGATYSRNTAGALKEVGAGIYNNEVSSRKSENIIGTIGTSLALNPMFVQDIRITPSLNASVDHTLHAKAGDISIDNNGVKTKEKVAVNKSQKTAVNLGASLGADYKSTNLTLAYDTTIKSKFISHQGSLQLRVNF